jgi:Xaa-Pro aminopeptidase
MAQIKTANEIVKIKTACNHTDAIFAKVIAHLRGNRGKMTEKELCNFILREIKDLGFLPSFPPIVTSGPRAGNEIHPQSTDADLKGFVIIDLGIIYRKYMSDMTRTIYIGKPVKKEKDLYNKVLASQELAVKQALPGVKCALLDKAARESLGALAKYFIHTLGHGVGTKIHESPKIFYKVTRPTLRENMIITIEPGIYQKRRLGIRIEDTCLITKKNCLSLTKSPKQLIAIY